MGGFAAGLVVALLAGVVSRLTSQREDSSLAAFYLISLALGVMLVSLKGSKRRPDACAVWHGARAQR